MWQACSASSRGGIEVLVAGSAGRCSSAVVKLPEEPSPVPAGMSAMLVISRCGWPSMPTSLSASRMMGCWISSGRVHHLHLRVLEDDLLGEGLVQRDVDVLVDGRRDHEAGVLAVVGRQVGPAAAQGDPQAGYG